MFAALAFLMAYPPQPYTQMKALSRSQTWLVGTKQEFHIPWQRGNPPNAASDPEAPRPPSPESCAAQCNTAARFVRRIVRRECEKGDEDQSNDRFFS